MTELDHARITERIYRVADHLAGCLTGLAGAISTALIVREHLGWMQPPLLIGSWVSLYVCIYSPIHGEWKRARESLQKMSGLNH